MAQNVRKVLLGYEDEPISDKYKNQVNFTTNKIGGKPDVLNNLSLDSPICPLCQLPRPLVMQIYAPLENSPYHRTLYLFACINPNCWNHSESWICLRIQSHEKTAETNDESTATSKSGATEWCSEADDWDDENNGNSNEPNGNLINFERVSDEDDESCSFDEALRQGMGDVTLSDRENANNGALGGAAGRLSSSPATAEIEGDEGEEITIESPTMPQTNLVSLLQEVTPLPPEICQNFDRKKHNLQFTPFFMSVGEENACNSNELHVKELIHEYQVNNGDDFGVLQQNKDGGGSASGGDFEKYEKSSPAHGDKMFHHFLSKIQANPGQILRYSREAEGPLLVYPLPSDFAHQKCQYCDGELVFEMQVLPTVISKLKLVTDQRSCSRLEFGTLLVFTCRKSCWSSDNSVRMETVLLQTEVF